MKKSLHLICLVFVFLLIGAGIRLAGFFPMDTQPYVEKKYAGWNGVLQAWVCTRWTPGGSFISWLNDCASAYEKSHEGVYLEFTPVTLSVMRDMNSSGLRLPDLVFFSPGVITNSNILAQLQPPETIRSDLVNYGNQTAIPIALGGYVWVYNPDLCEGAPQNRKECAPLKLPCDVEGYSFNAALLGLLSGKYENPDAEIPLPDPGIDLGLPASSPIDNLYTDDALDQFINGELACIPVCSKDLAYLARLQEDGRGPDWQQALTGNIVCTDQLLLAGIPVQTDESAGERIALAEEFINLLFSEDSQDGLADIGAHSVTGERIHGDFSVYALLDAWINSRPLWLPNCFSEYSASSSEAIVRRFFNEEISAKSALSLLGFEGM